MKSEFIHQLKHWFKVLFILALATVGLQLLFRLVNPPLWIVGIAIIIATISLAYLEAERKTNANPRP